MDLAWKSLIWRQFGAAIDMLENAMRACPEHLWGDRSQRPEFWYVAFHTLFFLDLYLSESDAGFHPPAPFTLDEMDERGLLPDRVYAKEELLKYLDHGRRKCRRTIDSLTDEMTSKRCGFEWLDISVVESHLYNMRHVQHHAGQLHMVLRQQIDSAPRWVRKTQISLTEK
ncbi:MAG: DinB family protein [Bacteroidota bacterium]